MKNKIRDWYEYLVMKFQVALGCAEIVGEDDYAEWNAKHKDEVF